MRTFANAKCNPPRSPIGLSRMHIRPVNVVEGSMGNSLGQVTFNVDEAYVHPR